MYIYDLLQVTVYGSVYDHSKFMNIFLRQGKMAKPTGKLSNFSREMLFN